MTKDRIGAHINSCIFFLSNIYVCDMMDDKQINMVVEFRFI